MTQPSGPCVLVVGGGAREHALIHALRRSPQRPRLLCAPGNAGIAAQAHTLPIAADDISGLVAAAREQRVELVVAGPEAPLVAGLTDALTIAGVPCFGPSQAAAQLEGSKAFCKEVMLAAGVPTAGHTVVTDVEAGMAAILGYPVVIKADGLAAGKGVTIATDDAQARATLQDLLVGHRFGTDTVVVEEYLEGDERSLFALCDGENAIPLSPAQDYKRIFDGDQGPNTGGMGAYSPVPALDEDAAAEICAVVHRPVLAELARRGAPFHGLLYAGLMMTEAGPKVLEFNVRFGDPETQAILPRLRTDLLALMQVAVSPGALGSTRLDWDERSAVTVVLASRGYPESSSSGDVITGLESLPGDVVVTHAGTARDEQGRFVTAGGRVLSVTAMGTGAADARQAAYAAADMIEFDGKQMRRDIAREVTA